MSVITFRTCSVPSHYLTQMLAYCSLGPQEQTSVKFLTKFSHCHIKKVNLKASSAKWRPFCIGLNAILYRPQYVKYTSILNLRKTFNLNKQCRPLASIFLFLTLYESWCTKCNAVRGVIGVKSLSMAKFRLQYWGPSQYKDVVLPV